jgi:hypothetical protein
MKEGKEGSRRQAEGRRKKKEGIVSFILLLPNLMSQNAISSYRTHIGLQ